MVSEDVAVEAGAVEEPVESRVSADEHAPRSNSSATNRLTIWRDNGRNSRIMSHPTPSARCTLGQVCHQADWDVSLQGL